MGRRGRNNRVLMLGLTLRAASSTRVDARNTSELRLCIAAQSVCCSVQEAHQSTI